MRIDFDEGQGIPVGVDAFRADASDEPVVSKGRPRIGIHDPSHVPSGPSRYVEGILEGIDPEEFEVVIFGHPEGPHRSGPNRLISCERPTGGPAPQRSVPDQGRSPQAAGRPWKRLVPGAISLWAGYRRSSARLAATFRECPVDLLHTNNTGCEVSAIAARMAGVPRILGTFHVDSTYDLERTRSRLRHRTIECLSNHCLHRAIAVSEATKRDWVRRTRLPADRVVTIPNGVDPDSFRRRLGPGEARAALGLPDDGRIWLGGVGRLDEAKGFADLIDAVAPLVREFPNVGLAIAGSGPLRDPLAERAAALGIADRVQFLGFQPDVRLVFEALDIFVLSSLCEAMPYALLEAMAMELPAVGTAVGGVPEVIAPDETGTVVPPHDPASLAAALRPLIGSADLRLRMGRAARERIRRHFDERETVRQTIQIYRDSIHVQ